MDLQSPYLEAIQAIPGSTPGEKLKELNSIARRIADGSKAHGDTGSMVRISDVPIALLPLVRVEIANVLRQPDGVVEALKSEDSAVIERALRMNWFFRGDKNDVINTDYFESRILPYVTLDTRIKLIKRLALNLRTLEDTKAGEDFYTFFARKYGRIQAEPLFIACGKEFIYDTVTAHGLTLSVRVVNNLFVRYPDLVIRYLKLSKPREDVMGWECKIDILCYNDFLPRLIKKHLNAFVELLEMHNSGLNVHLSNKSTETFLKSNIDTLLDKPKLYTSIMPIKVITAKLTKPQFKTMFSKLYPEKWQQFNYSAIVHYLKFYPEQERLSLVMETYEEVYNRDLLDNHDAIGTELLCMLPMDERTRQTRIKLEQEPDWRKHRYDITKAWRCYLPIAESIPSIKLEISRCSAVDDRATLLAQMLYTCKVNNDEVALIESLRYFTTRHKNEQTYGIFEVLGRIVEFFDVYTFGKEHWAILDDFIHFLDIKDVLSTNFTVAKNIIAGSLYYELVHDLPIENKIAMIMKINMTGWNQSWSTFEKYPEHDRRCFDTMLTELPSKFPQEDNIWKGRRCEVLLSIVKSIYEFNDRIVKPNNKITKLSVRSYPWLCELLKKTIDMEPEEIRWQVESIISLLKTNESELYKEWFPTEEDAAVPMDNFEALLHLRDDPQDILDHWEVYLKEAKYHACVSSGRRFLAASRWHQDIPIKFVERCLKDVADETDDSDTSLMVLGILMEGSALARVIEPLVPTDSTIETGHEKSKGKYKIVSSIPRAMRNTTPPVPLSIILHFCDGDYLNLALASLTNACRRTSVEKIKPFTKTLVDRRVSVRKHGIRLYCLVASIEDLKIFLTDLWRNETHRSIRGVVFAKIYNLFVSEPTPDTWMIMKQCIVDLKNDDNDSVEQLVRMDRIPDEYFADYIKQLLAKLKNLQANGFAESRISGYTSRVLASITAASINLLPEIFCQELLREYFFNPAFDMDINVAATSYALCSYIRPDKAGLESRLSFFCALYEDALKKHWDVPHPKYPAVCPINYLSREFVDHAIFSWDENPAKISILESILKSHLAVLKPEQDFASFISLILTIAFKEAKTAEDFGNTIGNTLPRIVEALSSELIVEITVTVRKLIEHRFLTADNTTAEMYQVIETLCSVGTLHSCILAAKLLYVDENRKFVDRHNRIVQVLRQSKHPVVVSLVYHHVNTTQVPNCET